MKKRPQPETISPQATALAEHGRVIHDYFTRVVGEGAWPKSQGGEEAEIDADTAELMATTLAEAARIRDERGVSAPYCAEQMISDIALALKKTGLQYINKRIGGTNKKG